MEREFARITSYCGIDCKECEFYNNGTCKGCVATKGRPFHAQSDPTCTIAACCIDKNIRYCADCSDIPCGKLKAFSNDPEHGDNPPGARIERICALKQDLLAKARQGIDPLAPCGFLCGDKECFLGHRCGGCRSGYNCCSYATAMPDGKCENVTCTEGKELYGCWECPEVETCTKGFFGNTKEPEAVNLAKANVYFIKLYGPDEYIRLMRYILDAKGMRFDQYLTDQSSVGVLLASLEEIKYEMDNA